MCNAICLGGPCHGLLTYVEQDVGTLTVRGVRYRVTRERVRYCGQAEPYIALHWADPRPTTCRQH